MAIGRGFWGIAVVALAALLPSSAEALMINRPGFLGGGARVCGADHARCITTPTEVEARVQVISYRDGEGEVVIEIAGKRYIALPNQVRVAINGCEMTVSSLVLGSKCPGRQ